ncbi:MAG TPA: hypothetical protein PK420_12470 [Rubrivivax sp.]|jgi:hypothetical protein|nr:hypothetical protein [Rubrivivax sp.]
MQRRAALNTLFWGCSAAALPSRAQAATSLAGHVLVWGPDGCCVASPDGTVQRLPDRLAAGTRPALTSRGLWLVNAEGTLRGWAPEGDHVWQLQHTVTFAAPVHALAASPDGRWVAAAHAEQFSLLDGRGEVHRAFDGTDLGGEHRGRATALFSLPQRRSFAVAWPALGEVWEISLDPQAAQIFDGLVHDYRMGEAIAKPGFLGARRAPLGRPLPHFSFADARVPWLAGILGAEVAVMHLDLRRRIAALQVAAAHPAGATLRRAARGHGAFEWWLPAGHDIHVFDTTRWQRAAVHTLPGPVRHLHAVDDAEDGAVWALVDQRGDAALWVLDGAASGMWRPVSGGVVSALAPSATPRGLPLLVLRRGPSALLQLDHRGGVRDQWPLPAGIAWQGIAAWPPN